MLEDSEGLQEVVIPHHYMIDSNFNVRTLLSFLRDPVRHWQTSALIVNGESIPLEKSEREDGRLLAHKVSGMISEQVTWL